MENIEELMAHFSKGEYSEIIDKIASGEKLLGHEQMLLNAYIKANYTDKALFSAIRLFEALLNVKDQDTFQALYGILKHQNVIQIGLRVLRETNALKHSESYYTPEFKEELAKEFDGCTIFPIIWPVAYGDSIVVHQFIKDFKEQNPDEKVLLIMPLNRPDLKELALMNEGIDRVIDVTLLPKMEGDRHRSVGIVNHGVLNITHQELMIQEILDILPNSKVIKLRYFPVLSGYKYYAGFRIWEERARKWVEEEKELPKLVAQTQKKKNKIVVHFRDGDYNDGDARDINKNYAQDLVNAISKEYPKYEIVKIGDAEMYELVGVRNACHEQLSITDQVKEIQQAKLFLGSHSAPQHLAVACSDTPVICLNYVLQETSSEIGNNIPCRSYEPIGKQVKKIFYTKMLGDDGKELLPLHHQKGVNSYESPDIEDVMKEVRGVLG